MPRRGAPRSCSNVRSVWSGSAVDADRLAFAAPPLLRRGEVDPELVARAVRGLGLAPPTVRAAQWVDNGPGWLALLIDDREQLLALRPDFRSLEGLFLGVVAPWPGGPAQFELRAFIGGAAGYEDPVTGSLNASVAQWLIGAGIARAALCGQSGRRAAARRPGAPRARRPDGVGRRLDPDHHRRDGPAVSTAPSALVDHLVIGAADLDSGVKWLESTFGVVIGAGGRHPLMATHNRLLAISAPGWPDVYLELIAIDPLAAAGPQDGRSRWFGLDDPRVRSAIARQPRLLHLVARTADLRGSLAALAPLGEDPGEPVAASRQSPAGMLEWQISVRHDGMPQHRRCVARADRMARAAASGSQSACVPGAAEAAARRQRKASRAGAGLGGHRPGRDRTGGRRHDPSARSRVRDAARHGGAGRRNPGLNPSRRERLQRRSRQARPSASQAAALPVSCSLARAA